ncbi:MAG: branched-chain amino acid ABC transporter permease [SAR324 cluster bacterium]|nr:branched-chain amino acid ABC transporter permease [SAR324 cluster bacterium]
MLEFVTFSLLNSLVYGMLLFLLSSGLTLIFSMMGVLNFAHASFYMIGAYVAYQVSTWVGFWPALLIAPGIVGIIGALVERYGLRKVHQYGQLAELLFTFGLAFIIEELVIMIWGRVGVDYKIPSSLEFTLFDLFDTSFPAYKAFMLVISVSIFLVLYYVLVRTRVGLIIQAALSHPEMVGALGHDVPKMFMLVFGGGSALAGVAGVIGGNALITEPAMAAQLGTIVFVVIVVGGMGSLTGALVASLLISFLQTFAIGFDYSLYDLVNAMDTWPFLSEAAGPWNDLLHVKVAQTGPVLPYLLLVLVLVVRPKGLMGVRET